MHVEVGARSTVPGLSARFTRSTPMGVGVVVVIAVEAFNSTTLATFRLLSQAVCSILFG